MSNLQGFGTIDGTAVQALTLEASGGLRAKIITFGARLTELHVPDRDGKLDDIVLGFDTIDEYHTTDTYFGATCGRFGNRIAKGRFMLDNQAVCVDTNEGANHLHGGKAGFDRKVWDVASLTQNKAVLTTVSKDGEMGFPGRCTILTTFELTDDHHLIITMEADTDRLTLMNMVHHSYFNLAGHASGDVLAQELKLASRFYTPVDDELLATGEVLSVADTPFDFRFSTAIGKNIAALESIGAVFEEGGGYDHNWCLDANGESLHECAEVHDPTSGRIMTLHTTEPGVQFYTGGYLSDKIIGKQGKNYCKYGGFTLETQKFPDAPNFAHFPHCRLKPKETYHQQMVFRFCTN